MVSWFFLVAVGFLGAVACVGVGSAVASNYERRAIRSGDGEYVELPGKEGKAFVFKGEKR